MNKALRLLEAAKAIDTGVDPELELQLQEWQELKKRKEVLEALAKKISKRVGELESGLIDIVKTSKEQTIIIDQSIIEYKTRKSGKRYAFTDVIKKAMELLTKDQRKIVEDFKESISHESVKESLKYTDPDLASYLHSIKLLDTKDLVGELGVISQITDKPKKKKDEGLLDIVKKVIEKAKKVFSKLKSSFKKGDSSIKEFKKAVAK